MIQLSIFTVRSFQMVRFSDKSEFDAIVAPFSMKVDVVSPREQEQRALTVRLEVSQGFILSFFLSLFPFFSSNFFFGADFKQAEKLIDQGKFSEALEVCAPFCSLP